MRICAVIDARPGEGFDGVWAPLGELPVLGHTLRVFWTLPDIRVIALIVRPTDRERAESLAEMLAKEHGVQRRIAMVASAAEGLQAVLAGAGTVRAGLAALVLHRGDWPLATADLIAAGVQAVLGTGTAVAAVPVKETIKVTDAAGMVQATPDRAAMRQLQFPAVLGEAVLAALRMPEPITLAGLVRAVDVPIAVFAGAYTNIPIVAQADLAVAQALLRR